MHRTRTRKLYLQSKRQKWWNVPPHNCQFHILCFFYNSGVWTNLCASRLILKIDSTALLWRSRLKSKLLLYMNWLQKDWQPRDKLIATELNPPYSLFCWIYHFAPNNGISTLLLCHCRLITGHGIENPGGIFFLNLQVRLSSSVKTNILEHYKFVWLLTSKSQNFLMCAKADLNTSYKKTKRGYGVVLFWHGLVVPKFDVQFWVWDCIVHGRLLQSHNLFPPGQFCRNQTRD